MTVGHDTPISKLVKDGWMALQLSASSLLENCTQQFISSSSYWQEISNEVPKVQPGVLYSSAFLLTKMNGIFINFARLGGTANTLEERNKIQNNLDRLEK